MSIDLKKVNNMELYKVSDLMEVLNSTRFSVNDLVENIKPVMMGRTKYYKGSDILFHFKQEHFTGAAAATDLEHKIVNTNDEVLEEEHYRNTVNQNRENDLTKNIREV